MGLPVVVVPIEVVPIVVGVMGRIIISPVFVLNLIKNIYKLTTTKNAPKNSREAFITVVLNKTYIREYIYLLIFS